MVATADRLRRIEHDPIGLHGLLPPRYSIPQTGDSGGLRIHLQGARKE